MLKFHSISRLLNLVLMSEPLDFFLSAVVEVEDVWSLSTCTNRGLFLEPPHEGSNQDRAEEGCAEYLPWSRGVEKTDSSGNQGSRYNVINKCWSWISLLMVPHIINNTSISAENNAAHEGISSTRVFYDSEIGGRGVG